MAEIAEGGGGSHDKGKKRAKKSSTKVDMTPMVDLAFLLLTFFVLTTTFAKPKVMSLVYPAKLEDTDDTPPQKINNAITFLLTEDKIFYYEDEFFAKGNAQGEPPTVRKLILRRNCHRCQLDLKLQPSRRAWIATGQFP